MEQERFTERLKEARRPDTTPMARLDASRVRSILCLVAILSALFPLHAAQLTATLDRSTIRVGESAKLSLNFENCQPSEAPTFPRMPNVQVTYGGQSSSIRLVNRQQSSVLTLFYFVTASQPGDYTIPRIVAPIGSDKLSTEPLSLKVVKADAQVTESEAQGQLAFLRLAAAKTNIYVGEVLPVETQLYVVSGQDIQMQPLPGAGFTFGKAHQSAPRQVQIGNAVYHLISLMTTTVANREGMLELGPAECRLSLRIPTERRRTGDPFEDFFDNPFRPRYELRPVKLTSDPLILEVQPLPKDNRPAEFAGAVGDFAFSVTASPTNVAVGEPIRLKVQVAGKGALESVNLPPLDDWRDFTTYPPTTEIETTDPLGVEGAKIFQYDVVPQHVGVKTLPELSFAFFDPALKAYRTLTHPPTPIVVRPAGRANALAPSPAAPSSSQSSPAPPDDIVGLKQRMGALAQIRPPLLLRHSFLALQLVPVLLLGAAFAWRKRREHLATHPRAVRRMAVQRVIRQGLGELSDQAARGDADAFFASVFRLLQEQLGERLDLPSAAITEAVLENQLREYDVPPDLIADLHALFQACNQQRYAPGATSHDLHAIAARVKSALRQLQKLHTWP